MDQRTLAFINMYAVLGSLEQLCELSPKASFLTGGKKVSIGFSVKGGPEATLAFENGKCSLHDGTAGCDIKLNFRTPDKFNGMIDGTVTPIPSKGFTKIKFLTGEFTKLTNLLSDYLRPKPEDMEDEEFFRISTFLMFHVIVSAVAQVGNEDRIGRLCAEYIVDGNIRLCIKDGPVSYLSAKNRKLKAIHSDTADVMSSMEFVGLRNTRQLFDGTASSFAMVCDGNLIIKGMISQLDNMNRILDRVGLYLA